MVAGDDPRMAERPGQGLGDARWLWRRLGGERTLSEAERRILADIERRCHGCGAVLACGRMLAGQARVAAAPAFCPSAGLFALLQPGICPETRSRTRER